MTTVHTVGVKTVLITDKEGNTRRIFAKQQMKPNFGGGGGGGVAQQVFETTDSSLASDPSFRKKNPKVANEVPPVHSIEKIFGINTTDANVKAKSNSKTKPKIVASVSPKKHVPEHLWTTRYMKNSNGSVRDKEPAPLVGTSDDDFDCHKSDAGISYSRSLILRARKDLAESRYVPPSRYSSSEESAPSAHSSSLEAVSPPSSPKRKESKWKMLAKNTRVLATDHKAAEDSKVDILQSYENLMKEERHVTSYIDGRRKNITQSEFRFNRDVDKLNTVDDIKSLSTVSDSSKDLLLWKKFCSERVVSVNKGHELKQIPIRAKSGFHTIYWGKLLIEKSNI